MNLRRRTSHNNVSHISGFRGLTLEYNSTTTVHTVNTALMVNRDRQKHIETNRTRFGIGRLPASIARGNVRVCITKEGRNSNETAASVFLDVFARGCAGYYFFSSIDGMTYDLATQLHKITSSNPEVHPGIGRSKRARQ